MGELDPGVIVAMVVAGLLLVYLVVRASIPSSIEDMRFGTSTRRLRSCAGGLYLDNVGQINGGLGALTWRSEEEKDRLRELQRVNEQVALSDQNPEWVVGELEKINDEVHRRWSTSPGASTPAGTLLVPDADLRSQGEPRIVV